MSDDHLYRRSAKIVLAEAEAVIAAFDHLTSGTDEVQKALDRKATAKRLLELLPPTDDGEPLSNAWLKSVGSDDESPACVNGHQFKLPDGSLLFLWGYEGERVYSATLMAHPEIDRNADDASGEIELGDIGTRGYVRRLAAALGITLTEPR